jgi:glycosyltransferase involved in cell wall biosynthesis
LKILVLCDRYPFPLTNGQSLRIFNYVRQLRGRHRFDLLCYGDAPPPDDLASLFDRINVFPRPVPRFRRGLNRLWAAFDVEQFVPSSEVVRDELTRRFGAGGYDVAWVSGWDMIVNVPSGCGPPVLADAVDDGVLEWWRRLRQTRGTLEKVRMLKRVFMNARFERRYFGRSDAALFVSDTDAEVFRRISPHTPTHVIHNGVDTDYFRPMGSPKRRRSVVFEGNMNFNPNVEAARFLVLEVLPLLQSRGPVDVYLVGNHPAPDVLALQGDRVHVTGYVDDVRPYLDQAAVFVCPMLSGAGIKNKILQAWAMALPVVATPQAIGGLAVGSQQNMIVGYTAQELAGAIEGLFADDSLRETLGRNGRSTVEHHYTWRQKSEQLDDLFSRLQ